MINILFYLFAHIVIFKLTKSHKIYLCFLYIKHETHVQPVSCSCLQLCLLVGEVKYNHTYFNLDFSVNSDNCLQPPEKLQETLLTRLILNDFSFRTKCSQLQNVKGWVYECEYSSELASPQGERTRVKLYLTECVRLWQWRLCRAAALYSARQPGSSQQPQTSVPWSE